MRAWGWGLALAAGLALLWVGGDRYLMRVVLACREAGWAGIGLFALLYCASAVTLVPAAILTVAAGWIWGLGWGALLIQAISIPADLIPVSVRPPPGSRASAPLAGLARRAGGNDPGRPGHARPRLRRRGAVSVKRRRSVASSDRSRCGRQARGSWRTATVPHSP